MERMVFRAQITDGKEEKAFESLKSQVIYDKKLVDSGEVMTLSVFCWKRNLFLYYENIGKPLFPVDFFYETSPFLETWPGEDSKRYWIPMMNIFHYNRPISVEHWKRKQSVQKRIGRIAMLKPEMVSSYIFYHYQLQEEQPASGNKYGMISIHENLLFFYMEEPVIEEPAMYEGKLRTSNTPKNWQKIMEPHFIFWEDVQDSEKIWRNAELVCAV